MDKEDEWILKILFLALFGKDEMKKENKNDNNNINHNRGNS